MKNIIKIAGFAAGLIAILWLLSLIFDGARWVNEGYVASRDARIAGIDTEQPGQIDVLNVGDSLCNVGLTPMELYRDYGYTAYNMGRDLQMPLESLFYIRQAHKRQPIKVIFWEAHNLFRDESIIDFGQSVFSEFFKYKVPFIKYHYIWKNWIEGPGIRKFYKGYLVNEEVSAYTDGAYYWYPDHEIYPIHGRQKMLFRLAQRYCRENDIKLVLYSCASAKCYDIRMHNAVKEFAQECGVDYLDANYDVEKIHIDWAQDTFDGGDHLNLYGCRKMTNYLGNYMADTCGLTDHRGDPAYQNWEELLPAYDQEIINMEGTSYPALERELGIQGTHAGQKKGNRHRDHKDGREGGQ